MINKDEVFSKSQEEGFIKISQGYGIEDNVEIESLYQAFKERMLKEISVDSEELLYPAVLVNKGADDE